MFATERVVPRNGPALTIYRGGQGAPLVWLHGIDRVRPDDPVLAALARHRTVIAPLAPGYGDLTEIVDLRDVHDLALHYDTVLETLGVGRVAIAGHSFGGMVAAEIAAHVPGRVSALMLASPLGLWNDAYPVADLVARRYSEMAALIWQGATHRPEPEEVASAESGEARIEALVGLANGLSTVVKYTWPIPDKGLSRRLYRIASPTLVLFGAGDAYVPARYAEDFAAAIAGARAVVRPGSHMLPYEDPERFAAEVAGFLAEGQA
jgi:pimeloyl-ACP methyl ester carboxylesterase